MNKVNTFKVDIQNNKSNQKNKRLAKYIKRSFFVLFLIVVFVISFLTPFLFKAKNAYISTNLAKTNIELGVKAIEAKNFKKASSDFDNAMIDFKKAFSTAQLFNAMEFMEFSGDNTKLNINFLAVNNILNAGIDISFALKELTIFGEELTSFIAKEKNTSFDKLSLESKDQLLNLIESSPKKLNEINNRLNIALLNLHQIPQEKLLQKIKENLNPLIEKTTLLKNTLTQSQDIINLMPNLIGYPDEKVYLFLLLNNTELRPSGGFIGTYGIVKIKDAKVYDFYTDNIYNLDWSVDAEKWPHLAPEPIQKYLGVEKWFMRDSNWSPDFAVSAEQALWFYHQEGGVETKIDGVIAITPDIIGKLLDYYGGITEEGFTFTSQNFVDQIEYKVEREYAQIGVREEDRKQIIGKLTRQLIDKLKQSQYNDILAITDLLLLGLDEKTIMIYDTDKSFSHLLRSKNWDGKVRETNDDFLMVVDANLGSLKTDQVMEKRISYNIESQINGDLKAIVSINYKNNGSFTWKTTRYNTYTRIYVPSGSKLIATSGSMKSEKNSEKGQIDIIEDLGKTVFGAFISIEPQEQKTLTFEYLLPRSIADNILDNSKYSLLLQKQPGTHNLFTIDAQFNDMIQSLHIGDQKSSVNGTDFSYSTLITTDKEFFIDF